ncbi:MAG: 30S ribosome-binding factor RbfA [Firmicutes bacterium]|nr:30S ribosome-binding factor RbfA [Bacillota bacterium]
MNFRPSRLAEEIKREVTDILRLQLKDPRISRFISITDVEVSKDLRHAKVFVSVFGSEEEQAKTLEGLKKASGFIRAELGKRIRVRYLPELSFCFDPSIQRGIKISQILREVANKREAGDS